MCVLLLARLSVGEEDRAYLINQLVLVKKENAVLGAQVRRSEQNAEAGGGKRSHSCGEEACEGVPLGGWQSDLSLGSAPPLPPS